MRNIFLIGFMGTGKSTVGKELSRLLGWRFIDMDQEIEREKGLAIPEIFAIYGEGYFRSLESSLLGRLVQGENQVISTGGGIVLKEENIALMKENGLVVTLFADPAAILERVKGDDSRPLLRGDAETRIRQLLKEREGKYERGDLHLDTGLLSPQEAAREIAAFVRRSVNPPKLKDELNH